MMEETDGDLHRYYIRERISCDVTSTCVLRIRGVRCGSTSNSTSPQAAEVQFRSDLHAAVESEGTQRGHVRVCPLEGLEVSHRS